MINYSPQTSIISSTDSSAKSCKSICAKIGNLFRTSPCSKSNKSDSSRRHSYFSRQTTGNYSNSTLSDESVKTVEALDDQSSASKRQRKQLVNQTDAASVPMLIPPFSPTYCKSNEFPYSNFYVKLPDGRWMVRYRDGNRDILRTDIMEGYMI
ncbi:hypothetical protein [Parasitella parasitica]|uniref:Uncharacterized protein n=1 Tax=Parasitella parasitica TaxID=35722 RepID=A0A0B7NUV4_9FUNG|nr:hypothetical protein [Parasitella parasitica]